MIVLAAPAAGFAQDVRTVLRNAEEAIGAHNVRTIRYSGSASAFEIDFDAALSHPEVPWAQQVDVWMTPHGFLKRAITANDATVSRRTIAGRKYNIVTYTVEDRYPLNESRENPGGDFVDVTYLIATRGKLTATINDQNMIEKVETTIDDMRIETTYSAYRDFAGIKFPTRIVQKRGGFLVLDLTVSDVKPRN